VPLHGCGTDIDPTAHVRFFAAFHHAPLCGASADVVLVDSDSARRISSARSRRRCTDLWTITSSGAETRCTCPGSPRCGSAVLRDLLRRLAGADSDRDHLPAGGLAADLACCNRLAPTRAAPPR